MQQPTWWSRTPRQIQLFTYVLVPVGVVLFALGLVLDYTGGWDGHEFLLNVTSSLTGLCFGGPTAVLLFNHLAHAQNEARQSVRARQRAAEETAALERALLSFFTSPNLADLTAKTAGLLDQANVIQLMRDNDPARDQAIANLMGPLRALLVPPASGRAPTMLSSYRNRSDELNEARGWRTRVISSWNALHTQVRRELPTDDWIPEGPATAGHLATEQLLKQGRNPWNETPVGDSMRPLRYFLTDLNGLCEAATALQAAYR
ncbi:hypothetical protein [Streptomyces sp. NBC_00140]|uniref:hypothetical protein n=1 Tax=Streptomyces sp. NBC_00140 TaxID=2975664 RepID=UPI00224D933E|nr:hypothetical protein [Streptomyces sp. NBC_00140]MCX5338244.1 hypothetical protein [Streptomyces sp. NBC_00140]